MVCKNKYIYLRVWMVRDCAYVLAYTLNNIRTYIYKIITNTYSTYNNT